MPSVLKQGVQQRLSSSLAGEKLVAGDDLGLLQNPQKLRQQQQQRWQRNSEQRREVACAAADRITQRVQQPPGDDERRKHHPAGDVHREDADRPQNRQRDTIAVAERRGDQHEGRYGNSVGGHIGCGGGVELDVGHRGERGRQRACRRGRAGCAPPGGSTGEQPPGQQAGAEREKPHRRSQCAERVGGRRRRPGELGQHRGQGVKRRRVVERRLGLDVAQFAGMRRRRLPGVENPPDGVGVPHRVPGAGNRLPVGHAAPGGVADRARAQEHARGRGPLR